MQEQSLHYELTKQMVWNRQCIEWVYKGTSLPKIGNDNLQPRGRLEKSAHQLLHNLNFKKK